jgi:6-phosphogluconolactonase
MKKLLLFVAALLPLVSSAQKKNTVSPIYDLLIGTYTNGTSKGIYAYRFYEKSGKLDYMSEFTTADNPDFTNPSYLCLTNNSHFIYAVNEDKSGKVTALSFVPRTGKFGFINNKPAASNPCYVSVDKDQKTVFVANYGSGNVTVYPVNADGSLGDMVQNLQDSGTGPNKDRQEGPHAHMVIPVPNEKYVLFTDLGTDKINVYRYKAGQNPPLIPAAEPYVNVKPGNGPRHMVFSEDGKYLYLVQELAAAINVYRYNNGKLTQVQTLSMLAPNFKGQVGAADIHISPNGRFLYASNRGDANEIVVYSINPDNGELTYVSRSPSMGKTPRNFVIDPSGNFLLVANQNSNNVVVYRIDAKTGNLAGVVGNLQIGNPVCLKFADAE